MTNKLFFLHIYLLKRFLFIISLWVKFLISQIDGVKSLRVVNWIMLPPIHKGFYILLTRSITYKWMYLFFTQDTETCVSIHSYIWTCMLYTLNVYEYRLQLYTFHKWSHSINLMSVVILSSYFFHDHRF